MGDAHGQVDPPGPPVAPAGLATGRFRSGHDQPAAGARWLAGDHHVHTTFSHDGWYSVSEYAEQAERHGLDWMVITDHGGVTHAKFGLDLVTPEIEQARKEHPGLRIFQGLEWNMPAAEHATVFVPPGAHAVDVLRDFEQRYDADLLSAPPAAGGRGVLARPTEDTAAAEELALAGLRRLAREVATGRVPIALVLANHPSRRGVVAPHELRAWNDTAPGVAIGMEGAPGHQLAGMPTDQGGLGRWRGHYDLGPGMMPDQFRGYPAEQYRLWGGFDANVAIVGGLWDSLLAEGRSFVITASSDAHIMHGETRRPVAGPGYYSRHGHHGELVDTGLPRPSGDSWPGAYSRTLVGAASPGYAEIMTGLRAGRVLAVHGGLVDAVDVRVRPDWMRAGLGVTVGGATWVERGGTVTVTVRAAPASRPNAAGEIPRLARLDLIAGPVLGPAPDRDAFRAPGTSVVASVDVPAAAFRPGADPVELSWVARNVTEPFYLRVRGTDGRRCGLDGGPLVDPRGGVDPWRDLWFYSNPVFVDLGDGG